MALPLSDGEVTQPLVWNDKIQAPIGAEHSRPPLRLWSLAIVSIGFLVGLLAASFSNRWPSTSWQNILLLTLGSGFISTSIISLMLDLVWSKIRADEEKGHLEAIFRRFEEFTNHLTKLEDRLTAFQKLGLNYCHPSRGEALSRFLDYAKEIAFRNAPNAGFIDIVSSSARGLIGHIDGDAGKVQREWCALITDKPMRFRILLTHPAYAHLRQAAEERPSGEIELEILKTAAYLHCIAGMDSSHLRFYRGSPTVFSIQSDKHILLNPYPYGNMALNTLSLEFESKDENSYVARFVHKHFNQTWKFADMAGKQVDGKSLVEGVNDFNSILEAFSECTYLGDSKRLRLARAQIDELDYFVSTTLRRDYGKFNHAPPEGRPFHQHIISNNLVCSDTSASDAKTTDRVRADAT